MAENEFEKIGDDIGKGFEKAAEEVVKVVSVVDKTDKVLHTIIAEEGPLKTILIADAKTLVQLAGEVEQCVTEKGLNLADDSQLMTDIKAYFAQVKATLVPEIEKVYGEIIGDVDGAAPLTPVPDPVSEPAAS